VQETKIAIVLISRRGRNVAARVFRRVDSPGTEWESSRVVLYTYLGTYHTSAWVRTLHTSYEPAAETGACIIAYNGWRAFLCHSTFYSHQVDICLSRAWRKGLSQADINVASPHRNGRGQGGFAIGFPRLDDTSYPLFL